MAFFPIFDRQLQKQ